MSHALGCYGAASVFSFDSETCRDCEAFFDCALESRKTLAAIQGQIDVSKSIESHDAALLTLDECADKLPQYSKCTNKELTFTYESSLCRSCPDYSECSEDTISKIENIRGIDNVRDLLDRHAKAMTLSLVEINKRDEEAARKYDEEEASETVKHPLQESNDPAIKSELRIPALPHKKNEHDFTALTHDSHLSAEYSCTLHEELVDSLIQVACLYRKEKDYLKIRDEFMRISLALNSIGLLAPIFRDQPRIPFLKKDRQSSHDQLLVDQIVIDCHWLWSRKEPVPAIWPELNRIFQNLTHFDCDAAATTIATRKWSSGFRADDLLTLTPRQQAQLVQLRSQDLKDKYRLLVDGKPRRGSTIRSRAMLSVVRSAIYAWADKNYRIKGQQDMYESLWLARELLGSKPSYASIGELAGLRCGKKPLSAKSVSDKLSNLDKELLAIGLTLEPTVGLPPPRLEE